MKNVATDFKAVMKEMSVGFNSSRTKSVIDEDATKAFVMQKISPAAISQSDIDVVAVKYSNTGEFRVYFKAHFYSDSVKTSFVSSNKDGVMDCAKLVSKAKDFAEALSQARASYDAKTKQQENNRSTAKKLDKAAQEFGMSVEPCSWPAGKFEVTFTGNAEQVRAFLDSLKNV